VDYSPPQQISERRATSDASPGNFRPTLCKLCRTDDDIRALRPTHNANRSSATSRQSLRTGSVFLVKVSGPKVFSQPISPSNFQLKSPTTVLLRRHRISSRFLDSPRASRPVRGLRQISDQLGSRLHRRSFRSRIVTTLPKLLAWAFGFPGPTPIPARWVRYLARPAQGSPPPISRRRHPRRQTSTTKIDVLLYGPVDLEFANRSRGFPKRWSRWPQKNAADSQLR